MKPAEKKLAREMALLWYQTEGKNLGDGFCDACVSQQTPIQRGKGYLVKGASSISVTGRSMEECLAGVEKAKRSWRSPDMICERCADANDFEAWRGPFKKPSWWQYWK